MLSAVNSDIIKIVDFGLSKRLNKRVVCMQGTPEFVRKFHELLPHLPDAIKNGMIS